MCFKTYNHFIKNKYWLAQLIIWFGLISLHIINKWYDSKGLCTYVENDWYYKLISIFKSKETLTLLYSYIYILSCTMYIHFSHIIFHFVQNIPIIFNILKLLMLISSKNFVWSKKIRWVYLMIIHKCNALNAITASYVCSRKFWLLTWTFLDLCSQNSLKSAWTASNACSVQYPRPEYQLSKGGCTSFEYSRKIF